MAPKAVFRTVLLKGVDNRAANLLKQEMLALGADAAVNRSVSAFTRAASDVLLMATAAQFDKVLKKLALQPFGLKTWEKKIRTALSNQAKDRFFVPLRKGELVLGGRPAVMGILNVTPDSFSDGGRFFDPALAAEQALRMESEGAAIIDIGGESSRPGSAPVSVRDEKKRVIPVVKALARKLKVPISIDTYKPEVAEAALDAGAGIVNDITGLSFRNGSMAEVVANYGAPVIIMHMQGMPATMQRKPSYGDVVADVADYLDARARFALDRGVLPEQIILDPGIGFGKTAEHNLSLLRRLREFKVLGYPLLVGTSRKGFIGRITGADVPAERLAGSLASAAWASMNGASIVRAHDVKETVQALTLLNDIARNEWN